MSSRKRAMKRAAKAARTSAPGVKRVATPEGEEHYGKKIGSIISGPGAEPKPRPQPSTLAQDRQEVHDHLDAFNNRKPDEARGEVTEADVAKTQALYLRGLTKRLKAAPSVKLRHYEKVLSEIVEQEIDEKGHHRPIPAFHRAKKNAADELLDHVRAVLSQRPRERGAFRRHTLDAHGEKTGVQRHSEDGFVPGYTVGSKAGANRASHRAVSEGRTERAAEGPSKSTAYADKQRRLKWEAWNKAREADIAAAPEAVRWAREAIDEMADTISVPDKVNSPKGRPVVNKQALPKRVAAIEKFVAELRRSRGGNEQEIYDELIKARGGLTEGMRHALYVAAGREVPKVEIGVRGAYGTGTPEEKVDHPLNLRPDVKPRYLDQAKFPKMSEAALTEYVEKMYAHASSIHLKPQERKRALDAAYAARNEINRRSAKTVRPPKHREADLSDAGFVEAVRAAGGYLIDADAKAQEDLRARRRKRGKVHHEGTDPRSGGTDTSRSTSGKSGRATPEQAAALKRRAAAKAAADKAEAERKAAAAKAEAERRLKLRREKQSERGK